MGRLGCADWAAWAGHDGAAIKASARERMSLVIRMGFPIRAKNDIDCAKKKFTPAAPRLFRGGYPFPGQSHEERSRARLGFVPPLRGGNLHRKPVPRAKPWAILNPPSARNRSALPVQEAKGAGFCNRGLSRDCPGVRRGWCRFGSSCVYRLRSSGRDAFHHGPLQPFTILRAEPGVNRRTGIDKLVASRTVVQS